MNSINNTSHYPRLVLNINSWGRSSLCLCAPWSCFDAMCLALAGHFFLRLLSGLVLFLGRFGRCIIFVVSWSFGYNLCSPVLPRVLFGIEGLCFLVGALLCCDGFGWCTTFTLFRVSAFFSSGILLWRILLFIFKALWMTSSLSPLLWLCLSTQFYPPDFLSQLVLLSLFFWNVPFLPLGPALFTTSFGHILPLHVWPSLLASQVSFSACSLVILPSSGFYLG